MLCPKCNNEMLTVGGHSICRRWECWDVESTADIPKGATPEECYMLATTELGSSVLNALIKNFPLLNRAAFASNTDIEDLFAKMCTTHIDALWTFLDPLLRTLPPDRVADWFASQCATSAAYIAKIRQIDKVFAPENKKAMH